jgi:type I restriction enzyme S subunit
MTRLRHVFNFNKGLTITKENLQEEGVPCVNYGEIHSKYAFEVDPDRHALRCVDASYLKNHSASLLRRGDFVFADTSEDIAGSGNFTCFSSDRLAFAGYHTLIAKPKMHMNSRFMAYLLDSASFRAQVQTEVTGVKVFSISQTVLKPTLVWFPPEQEQDAIVAFLDEKCAKVDEAVRIKAEQIALLRERRQILIQQAVTRGLDPSAPMKDSGIDWIGHIPAHWEVRRSKYVFTQRKELARKDDIQLSATQSYGVIPQEKFEEIVGRRVVRIQTNLEKRKHVELDDFVISMRSFQGGLERAFARGCIRSSYVILQALEPISPDFFGYLFKSPRYIKALQATGSFIRDGQDLSFDNFSKVDLFLPPIDEQADIAAHILAGCEKIDTGIAIKEDQIAALKEYKTSLINAAVTGKIKVA